MGIFLYIAGFIFGLFLILILFLIFLKTKKQINSINSPKISQSLLFKTLRPFVLTKNNPIKIKTQSSEFQIKNTLRVILVDHKAYWIFENTLYVADEIDGLIDKNSMRPVDTMAMDAVQLDKTAFIVESLTEGIGDDNWNSGNKKF